MSRTTNEAISNAVKALRKRMGWNQSELARRARLQHHQIVSEIERGKRSLKAAELVRLAELFHVDATDLLSGKIPAESQPVLWRETRDEDARHIEEAAFLQRCRRYAFVERITGGETSPVLPSFSLNIRTTSYETVERWAEQIRGALDLGDLPSLSLRKVLEERAAVKLFLAPLKGGSGATTRGEFGDAILESSEEPPTRRAFSLGHELFHILTWDTAKSISPDMETRNEQLANVFASSLILPSDKMRDLVADRDIGTWPWHRFLPLAESMAVSPSALLWRLVHMKLLPSERAQELLSSRGRGDGPSFPQTSVPEPELPRRFVLLAFRAWADGLISIGKLAELLETSVGMLERRLSEYGLDLDEDMDEVAGLPS